MIGDDIAAVLPVVDALDRMGVPYYIGGSVASSAYGRSRSTAGVDLIADMQPRHARPLAAALGEAYYADPQMMVDAIFAAGSFNVIHLATMFKVDVFPVKDRDFDRRTVERVREMTLSAELDKAFRVAAPEDVVINKLEWFRAGQEVSERQWRDVIEVMAVQRLELDRDYLTRWAKDLRLEDLLERAWQEVDQLDP